MHTPWSPMNPPPGYTRAKYHQISENGGLFAWDACTGKGLEYWRKLPAGARRQKGRSPKVMWQLSPEEYVWKPV